ncbi:MAG: phosphoethanolamine transferase [Plesiomonas sp.]|uniref:phosphoethanolamine transferase n=1 Tax=Plesiomonas sp. TaxID=2486279 RepID=UPI003F3D293C
MNKKKFSLSWQVGVFRLTFLLSLYYAIVLNYPIYVKFKLIFHSLPTVNTFFVISIPFVLLFAINFLFNVFNWKLIFKPFFVLLILTSSIVSYATTKYGVIFTTGMIQNIVETDVSEASSYLNLSFIAWFLFFGILPSVLIISAKIKYPDHWLKSLLFRAFSMIISIIALLIIGFFFYKDYASIGRNNAELRKYIIPSYYTESTYKYIKTRYFTTDEPYKQLGTDAVNTAKQHENKPTLLVLVVGETARSQNYQLNGYSKPTNQYTKDLSVISFQHVRSCGTATAVSVPCMFSTMTKDEYNGQQAHNQDGLLDILHHAGVSLLWKDNDGGCKGVCDRIPHEMIKPLASDPECNGSTCYDGVFLETFDQDIKQLEKNGKTDSVLTLHLMGSHGPTYYLRYPPSHRYFVPDCPRSDIENCSNEALVNTYDNTILYTDYVLSEIIKKLSVLSNQYNTALIYLSDHGESLGENGLYLHGTPYDLAPAGQTTIPLITWLSNGFSKAKDLNIDCLKKEATKNNFSQDNLIHSVLGIMDIKTKEYNPKLDIFQTCRNTK